MKRRWRTLGRAGAGLLLLAAGVTLRAETPATTQAAPNIGMMWKATTPTTVVYLVGSVHAASPDMYPLPPAMEAAFKDSKVLVVEVDVTKANTFALAMKAMKDGMYTNGDTLDKHLPAETWKQLQKVCDDLGLPAASVASMKPWLAGVTVQGLVAMKAGLDPESGIDMHFLKADKGKRVVELETAESQLDLMANLTEDEQLAMVDMQGETAASLQEKLKKLIDAWKRGDAALTEKLEADSETGGAAAKSISKKLIDDRNGPMAEKIAGLAGGNDHVFVVVGAAHLLGDNGVVALLQKKGMKVERVEK
jgi:uncharacterized protein YbaP (TraB family)